MGLQWGLFCFSCIMFRLFRPATFPMFCRIWSYFDPALPLWLMILMRHFVNYSLMLCRECAPIIQSYLQMSTVLFLCKWIRGNKRHVLAVMFSLNTKFTKDFILYQQFLPISKTKLVALTFVTLTVFFVVFGCEGAEDCSCSPQDFYTVLCSQFHHLMNGEGWPGMLCYYLISTVHKKTPSSPLMIGAQLTTCPKRSRVVGKM